MTNQQIANNFLQWVNDNYDRLKSRHKAYCVNTKNTWDEDVFSDTYLKIFDKIQKNGIKDNSESGFENYMFMSFKTNIKRELQYARNQKRDNNNNLSAYNESFKNGQLTEEEKLKQDIYKDFAMLYLLKMLDNNFPQSDFKLFRLKLFDRLTYKQLAEKTKEKAVRQRIVNMKNWLKENVTKEEIINAFNEEYGDLVND